MRKMKDSYELSSYGSSKVSKSSAVQSCRSSSPFYLSNVNHVGQQPSATYHELKESSNTAHLGNVVSNLPTSEVVSGRLAFQDRVAVGPGGCVPLPSFVPPSPGAVPTFFFPMPSRQQNTAGQPASSTDYRRESLVSP